MTDEVDDLWGKFQPLYADAPSGTNFFTERPLVAHYTSLYNLEKILTHNQLWFSNPLFMNDMEEVRFGLINGTKICRESKPIRDAFGTEERFSKFVYYLDHYLSEFDSKHLLDTYIFCLSEHDRDNNDGLLSMWRGYGANGNGVALIFDPANMTEMRQTPLVISKVVYGSVADRLKWIEEAIPRFCDIVNRSNISDDNIFIPAYAIFSRIKLFSVFTKHTGFKEEREWRIAYFSEMDSSKSLTSMLSYHISSRGVEPKLKLTIEPIDGIIAPEATLEKLIHKIILGPTTSSELAYRSIKRMLELIGKDCLKERVVASTIPFRAI